MSISLKYYIKNSDLPFTVVELIAMYIETFFYQKWIKKCEINNKFKIDIIQILSISLFLTDLFLVITKKKSITTKYLKDDIIIYDIFLPILLFIIQIILFNHIIVTSYYITYTIEKYLFFVLNCLKIISTFHNGGLISDMLKIVNCVYILNILLIVLTDPMKNTGKKNKIVFYELAFIHSPFYLLSICHCILYTFKRIKKERNLDLNTSISILGENISFILFFLLVIFHNIIIIIQGILIHPFMWISLINLFPMIICIYYFWYYKINKSYIWFVIALLFYLCLFIFNLYLIK